MNDDTQLSGGDIALDETTLTLRNVHTGESVRLGDKEFRILECFLRNRGRILTRDQLAQRVWGYDSDAEYNKIEVYLTFTRRSSRSSGRPRRSRPCVAWVTSFSFRPRCNHARSSSLFAQSRRRIIAAIMAVLLTLFVATLAAIYAFSYAEVYDRNTHMLENYAANYQANRLPSGFVRPDNLRQRQFENPSPSAPFYAVLFDANGSVVSVESINANGYTISDLVGFAHNALDKNERSGLEGSLMFAVERTAGYTLVAFMDNTLVTESMGTLFRCTLIVGLVMLVLLFFVARWLAGRIGATHAAGLRSAASLHLGRRA